jgi:regulation of enolase protein 1 (concanavalin A-like superfamily)
MLVNPSFETNTSGAVITNKITAGFDVSGNNVAGWLDAGTNYVNSGVDYAGDGGNVAESGTVFAYCDSGDSGAYQITGYQMKAGDQLTLTWWAKSTWGSAGQTVSLMSGTSTTSAFSTLTTLATSTAALNNTGAGGAYSQYTLTYTATSANAGNYVAVFFKTSGTTGGSWAAFDNFSLGVADQLPSPWASADIGAVGVAGSAACANGLFTVAGSGADIWGTADAFHYVYQPGGDDCTIQAEVLSVQNTAPWAKAGVMVRETTNANSTYAIVFLSPVTATSTNGVAFQERATTGGSAKGITNTPGLKPPYWVRLARTGNSFVGYYSANGTSWTAMGTNSITMATNVYMGLPVSSVNNSELNTSTFTNVTATP